jgi:hypothetical protein
MPLQGHWERQNTPLRVGERRTVAIVAGVLAVAVAVVLYLSVVKTDNARAGCVFITVPSTMGAGNMHACGDAARRLCASQVAGNPSDPFARAAHKSCREAGLPAPPEG